MCSKLDESKSTLTMLLLLKVSKEKKIRWILQNRQIEWLSEYFSRMNGKRITTKTVKLDIINQFPEIRNISLSTVARMLKQRVSMSYKKLHKREAGTFKKANIIKYIDSAWIIQTLSNTGWELIYFDELGWDSRRSQLYGWCRRGDSGYMKLFNDKLNVSFIWAISKEWFYGVMGVSETTDSRSIIKFIKEIWEFRMKRANLNKKKFILVSDNASVNVWDEVSKFVSSSGLRMIKNTSISTCHEPSREGDQLNKDKDKRSSS